MSRAARRSEAVERFAERGRQRLWAERVSEYPVAPRAGAWIETCHVKNLDRMRRAPRGRVD